MSEDAIAPTKKQRRALKRIGIIGATLAIAVGTVGVALAAWTSTGTGNSQQIQAGTAAANGIEVIQVTPLKTGLFPTKSETSAFRVKNNNDYAVTLSNGVLNPVIGVSGGGPGCSSAAAAAVTGVINDVSSVVIPAGATVTDAKFFVTVSMGINSHNDCQAAIFTPSVSVSAAS